MRSPRLLPFVLLLTAALTLAACGGGGSDEQVAGSAPAPGDEKSELEHIHGLGLDPGSGSLYVATHYGLFRAAEGQTKLQRVGESRQDVMGFSVVGPRRFIGSGHPDPSQNLPPNLGLIESRDGGETWKNVSLLGEADFHVLRSAGSQIYGFNSGTGELMVSTDGGREWARRTPPAGMFDLAIDPTDVRRIVTSTEDGIFVSTDAGETWRPWRDDLAGLLAWSEPDSLFIIDGDGRVARSADAGKTFDPVGSIDGPPSAFVSHGRQLYAALGDGNILRSTDGGANWVLRAAP
jgi:photosystem II stability/assembly factor-like uncharacterized protein/predicted small secreted protein